MTSNQAEFGLSFLRCPLPKAVFLRGQLVQRQTDAASARSASRLLLLQARLRVAQLARLRIEPLAGTAQLTRRRLRGREFSFECLACGV